MEWTQIMSFDTNLSFCHGLKVVFLQPDIKIDVILIKKVLHWIVKCFLNNWWLLRNNVWIGGDLLNVTIDCNALNVGVAQCWVGRLQKHHTTAMMVIWYSTTVVNTQKTDHKCSHKWDTMSSYHDSFNERTLTKLPIFCENLCEPIVVGNLCPAQCPTKE